MRPWHCWSRPGGWIGGFISDRWGLVVTLQVTIAWFSIFTGLSGLTNSFEQLLIVRALQGLGFGAEWAVGAALLGEMVRPEHRGKALGLVQSAWAVGWGAAAIVYTITFYFLPETWAWRALFFIGVLPGLFVVYLRRYVHESEVFRALSQQGPEGWPLHRDLFRANRVHDSTRCIARHRGTGRLLRSNDMAADLSEGGSPSFGSEHSSYLAVVIVALVARLRGWCLSFRRVWQTEDLSSVFDLLRAYRHRLHIHSHQRRADACSWIPARVFCLRNI